MDNGAFSFIVSTGPKLPKDPKVRTAIRKQAMRDAAAARRRRNADAKGSSTGTLSRDTSIPEGTVVSDSSLDDTSTTPSKNSSPGELVADDGDQEIEIWREPIDHEYEQWSVDNLVSSALKVMTPFTPYEEMRVNFGLDIIDLAHFTTFNINNLTAATLRDTDKLNSLLGHKVWSYLCYVPSRYGISNIITVATDCVLAKLASRLDPDKCQLQAKAWMLYSQALKEVQTAVSNPDLACRTDTLCAISLLSLHELLDPDRETPWRQHVAGSAQIIKHRQASSFTTQFEKALLYAHLGPAITEAFQKFEHCYLEAPEWHYTCLSLAEETTWLSNRSPLTVRMRLNETFLPGLVQDTNAAVMNGSAFHPIKSRVLRQRVQHAHDDMLKCLDDYQAHIVQTSLMNPPNSEIAMRREIFGAALECLCIYKRLMGTYNESDRIKYEEEGLALAMVLRELHNQKSCKNDWLFIGHELGIAKCVISTGHLWNVDCSAKTEEQRQKLAFERWIAFASALARWEDS